jgi:hypothetical protein
VSTRARSANGGGGGDVTIARSYAAGDATRGTLGAVIDPASVRLRFAAELIYWRGPSPFHYLAVPPDGCEILHLVAPVATYGWGVIPVRVTIGGTVFSTSLFPRDGGYLVPVKDAVRKAEHLALGDEVEVDLTIRA